eukprot:923451-Amphidinium_carterae.1
MEVNTSVGPSRNGVTIRSRWRQQMDGYALEQHSSINESARAIEQSSIPQLQQPYHQEWRV